MYQINYTNQKSLTTNLTNRFKSDQDIDTIVNSIVVGNQIIMLEIVTKNISKPRFIYVD